MTQRTPQIFLQDIIHSMDKIERFTRGMTDDDFEDNELVIDAVIRNLEIMGEAARNIPDSIRANYPHIPWKRIVGLRNIVTHAYFNVDLTIIWQIVVVNLPETKGDIQAMLDDLSD